MEKNPTIMLVVAGALRAQSGHWLMHRRPPGKHHAGLWEFPGGKVESGETSEIALIRELEEELGVQIAEKDLAPVGFATLPKSEAQPAIVILLYICAHWEGDVNAREGGKLDWFELEAIANLSKPPLDEQLLDQLVQKHRS